MVEKTKTKTKKNIDININTDELINELEELNEKINSEDSSEDMLKLIQDFMSMNEILFQLKKNKETLQNEFNKIYNQDKKIIVERIELN